MLKFHEYLAKRDGISLDEAARRSLARTWELAQTGKVMALITAFVRAPPYDLNAGRNLALARAVRDAGFGYTPLYGYWTYEATDPETWAKTGEKEKVREAALLVSASQNLPNPTFRASVLGWVRQFQQEAAVVKYADSDVAFLLTADGREVQLGRWSINRLADVYSQMKKGNRSFVFEAADDHSWSTRLAMSSIDKG